MSNEKMSDTANRLKNDKSRIKNVKKDSASCQENAVFGDLCSAKYAEVFKH